MLDSKGFLGLLRPVGTLGSKGFWGLLCPVGMLPRSPACVCMSCVDMAERLGLIKCAKPCLVTALRQHRPKARPWRWDVRV